jgi:hypothetical protein
MPSLGASYSGDFPGCLAGEAVLFESGLYQGPVDRIEIDLDGLRRPILGYGDLLPTERRTIRRSS